MTTDHELIQAYRDHLAAWRRSPETITLRMHQLRRLAAERPGLLRATPSSLASWLAGHAWAAETARSHLAGVRGFYAWAVQEGHLDADPTSRLPRLRPAPPVARPAPARVVQDALAAPAARTRLMVHLAARQGLRRGEIARVHAQDVLADLVGSSLVVQGKGAKQRLVPLHADVAGQLRARIEQLGGGWVFPGQIGGHLSPRRVGELVRAELPAAWTTHTLRHWFATQTYASSHDVLALMRLMGHSRPEVTMRYVEQSADVLRQAIAWAA